MATVVAPMYSGHHHTFLHSSSRAATLTTSVSQPQQVQQQEQDVLDDQFTTLFCRALYDYEAQDASALSFRRNDIIEVLTQQPSGWWDGLLGDERGWFPSNYVTVISDEEAELAFSGSEFSNPDGMVAVGDISLRGGAQGENEEWLDNEITLGTGMPGVATVAATGPSQPSDFWMPDVAPDGQIYYVNTQTGQRSRDLPQEADDDVSDGDLAGLTTQTSSRSGTSAGLGFGPNGSLEESGSRDPAGFGILRRTGTPEPWARRLADDGMSYYYYNTLDGQVQWTRPDDLARALDPQAPHLQSQNGSNRHSIYSDDSDVDPLDPLRSARPRRPTGPSRPMPDSPPQRLPDERFITDLTSAERIAQTLQQALSPPPPELVTDLSAFAKSAIQAVVDNIQPNGLSRQPEEDERMDELIDGVVLAVRNLLYVSAAPAGQIPSYLLPRDAPKPNSSSQSPLKPAQRKVTATLSRLVLSARAMQYDSGSSLPDTLTRIEVDADELERAVLSFVLEVQRTQHTALPDSPEAKPHKRLQGVFSTANVGLGLVGAGAAAGWKGFGWVATGDPSDSPGRVLGTGVLAELSSYLSFLEEDFSFLARAVRISDETSVDQVRVHTQELITKVSALLMFIADIHVARHVDIDGRGRDGVSMDDHYSKTVEKSRSLVRTLETAVQSLYDDSTSLLLIAVSVRHTEPGQPRQNRDRPYDQIDALATSLKSNLGLVHESFDALLSVGHDQADMAQGDYSGSIEWRMSRLSVIDNHLGGGTQRPLSSLLDPVYDAHDDVVDMAAAFGTNTKSTRPRAESSYAHQNSSTTSEVTYDSGPSGSPVLESTVEETAATSRESADIPEAESSPLFRDDPVSPPRANGGSKLHKFFGDEYTKTVSTEPAPKTVPANLQPWYLRPNYSPSEIIIDPDGSVRGGTVPALVERLTAHEHGDPTFIKAFLMTFKSFTTLDELFDVLVERFRIQPPPGLSLAEHEDWVRLKQHIIQMRVINTFKSMVVDDDVLEKEDLYILDRLKQFISSDEVSGFPAAKQLMILIERAQGGDNAMKMMMANQGPPPPPIVPKFNKKLKLLDIDPLELARQLTIMESQLYQRIRPMECLQRAREQRTENVDNIAIVIQTSNRIADWVAESILSRDDSRKRAVVVKHLISVADRCRTLNNFSTMIAITSGLNTPPIRRLKRTWEPVGQRFMAQFAACEMTIDSNRNFTKYRQLMASVTPPCVPFIGVFLSTLQFIQDGNPDNLPGNLVNFRKRQKASEVINDIKRWQAQTFNFQTLPLVQAYIEESLNQFSDTRASSEHFWTLSLEREPREREDEKMARLLQESGFL